MGNEDPWFVLVGGALTLLIVAAVAYIPIRILLLIVRLWRGDRDIDPLRTLDYCRALRIHPSSKAILSVHGSMKVNAGERPLNATTPKSPFVALGGGG